MRLAKDNLTNIERSETGKFAKWLLDIGDGIADSEPNIVEDESQTIEIPQHLLVPYTTDPLAAITKAIYDDFL